MSKQKLRVKNTQLDNLTSNLRGEVGEIIMTWVVMRDLMAKASRLRSDDIAKNLADQNLAFLEFLTGKLGNELVARLSELAEPKIGQLTFHFAATKLSKLDKEVKAFRSYISRHKFDEKRNCDISHKVLPEQWSDHKYRHIPYRILLRGVASAMWLMKKIDRVVLGPVSKYLWHEMRTKRYKLMNPAKVAYMLLPYLNLSKDIRARVLMEEVAEGREVWSEMATTIDGHEARVPVSKEWGAILLGGRLIVLDHYPLQQLSSIKLGASDAVGNSV